MAVMEMPSALQVLLRALGVKIDPQEIMDAANGIGDLVRGIDARMQVIERQQSEILDLLKGNNSGAGTSVVSLAGRNGASNSGAIIGAG